MEVLYYTVFDVSRIRMKMSNNQIDTKAPIETVFLSFGENCLADNVLSRHDLKSFTTPYSHGRSCIEHILQLEYDRYKHLLCLEHLSYRDVWGTKAVVNDYYKSEKVYLDSFI